MKQFVLRIIVFIIPLFLVSAVLEYKIRSVDSYYKQKINGLISQADSIEVLILGCSHAAEGIDPGQFDMKAYNMAFGSQTLYYDKRLTINRLNELTSLKYVLISIDYQSLYYPHNPTRDLFYHYYYDIDYDEEFYMKEDISYFFFGFKPETSMQILSNEIEHLDDGWFSYDTTYYSSFSVEAVSKRVEHFNAIIQANLLEKQRILSDLDQFIVGLIDNEIVPIIISSPLHKSYLSLLDTGILRQNQIDIHTLCEKYDLEYWSYQDEPFEDWEYLDNSHLNRSGARRYSSMLNDNLIALSTASESTVIQKRPSVN